MRTSARARRWRPVLILAALAALLLPSVSQVAAADPVVLRVGETQDVTAINPYLATLFSDYEVFTLNYDLLVGYDKDSKPAAGFASSWTQDGTTWTFKIDPDLKWSDGTPATAEDARWTLQTVLDVQARDGYVGSGYLDPYLTYAGVTKVSSPDAQTLVVETEWPNTQILTSYLPILPKHIWEKRKIEEDPNDVPIVGTGPYQATEWKPGQYVHLVRNKGYRGKQGYADEIFIQYFADEGAMTEALKAGTIDYARNPTADQFDSLKGLPGTVPVKSKSASEANAFTDLGFNTYSKPIKGGGASTKALQDPKFRDALGYAIDKPLLVDRVLKGYGTVGSTIIPPAMARGAWHLEPANLRTFDIELAKQKLLDADYPLDANGKRLDKEGKPIVLRMVVPDTSSTYAQSAEFITDWWKQLGIDMTTQAYDSDTLIEKMLPPEGEGTADFDVFIWNWGGDVDPNSLLNIATTVSIGSLSDSFYSNPHYDELMTAQFKESDPVKRKAIIDEMQQTVYDDAPYHVLFYDDGLHAYRTDRFGGWHLQPSADGLPFFGYGAVNYTELTAPEPEATPTPAASAEAPAPGASATPAPTETGSTGGDSTPLIVALGALVLVGVVAVMLVRRRRTPGDEEEE